MGLQQQVELFLQLWVEVQQQVEMILQLWVEVQQQVVIFQPLLGLKQSN